MTQQSDEQEIDLLCMQTIDYLWMQAAANALEYEHDPFRAMASGSDEESVKLCQFAAVVPGSHHEHYMNNMINLHNRLVKQYPQVVSNRPEKVT